jgi:hypothetical protein
MTDQLSHDDLRSALHAAPDRDFAPVPVPTVIRAGRRRRTVRRAATALAVTVLVVSVGAATTLLGGGTSTTTPAGGTSSPPALSAAERQQLLVVWADCLREQGIPGVTVVGPAAGSDEVSYLDDAGKPLPANFGEQNGEWGSASELCAARVPALMPELERQWGVTARQEADVADYRQCLADHELAPMADPSDAEAAGCVFTPYDIEAEQILQCPAGTDQSGMLPIEGAPWVETPEAAGRSWLAQQDDPAMFATVQLRPNEPKKSRLDVLSEDGQVSGLIYLLTNTHKGWRLHSVTHCQ